ncbi:MAG: competence/damage-inducible protein A [Clostridia bacterium]|nr:competence/damage-inducible protein A [Clostridia bacterium]
MLLNCELISVGTEILLGDILNTNARFLSKELAALGISLMYQTTVGDNEERLKACLDLAFSRADTVILTGGLGPTPDDLTKEVCADYFGKRLIMREDILEEIKSYFYGKGLRMPESNAKQALVPEDSTVLLNENGTAPGFIMENKGRKIIILPGPPREMEPMFRRQVIPYLKKFSDSVIKSHTVRTFGIGESAMSERVADLLEKDNPTVAPYAKDGEALLRITAKAENEEEADKLISPLLAEIKERLGSYIYGIDAQSIEEATVSLMKEKKLTAAFAESCTAGLCAKRITDISGASEVFHCGVVSYSDDIKEKLLGVSSDDLSRFGAVSEIVAAQMALGIKRLSGADYGVAVTGMAGPTSDDPKKEVGLIYIAVTDGESLYLKEFHGRKNGSCRDYNRFVSASNAINQLRLCILNSPELRSEGSITEFINSYPRN